MPSLSSIVKRIAKGKSDVRPFEDNAPAAEEATPELSTAMEDAVINEQEYDLLFLVDATTSMGPYLAALNQALPQIIALSKLTNCFARIGILAYRDYDRLDGELLEWSGWLTVDAADPQPDLHAMARELQMHGGRSWPEAVKTGLARAYELMRTDAKTVIMLFADAPPHSGIDLRFKANAHERTALTAPGSYSGCGHIFSDWVKGSRQLRGPGKIAQVLCIIENNSSSWSGVFEYISAVTNGACIHLDMVTARNISQITVDVLLAWMGVKKDGATVKNENDPLLPQFIAVDNIYHRHRLPNITDERLTMGALETCLVKRAVPVQDLSKMYTSDLEYRSLVATELRHVIENDVTIMSLNPVFGSLWRKFCNDRSVEGRQAILDLFGSKIEAITDCGERASMKAWLEESYDYSADVLATIASEPAEEKFPCRGDDDDEDERPITDFTRDELLEVDRSCDWKVLKRLGRVLTRLTFIESAADMPAHIAATSDAEVPKIPLALAKKEHGRHFWNILLHIVVPGTKLGGRTAALLAALTLRLGVKPLEKPDIEQMLLWKNRWNNLDVPETWSNASAIPDSLGAGHDSPLSEHFDLLELNLPTTLHAKVTWKVEQTMMPFGRLVICNTCNYPRSVTIMAANGLCGICAHAAADPKAKNTSIQRGASVNDTETTNIAWYECNLAKCRAQYVIYSPEALNVKPKCYYCRFTSIAAPVVHCTKCLSKVIWPEEYRDGDMKDFACMGCETGRKTVVEVETTAEELRVDNGTDWLVVNESAQIAKLFAGLSLYKTAVAVSPLDTFAQNVAILPGLPEAESRLMLSGRVVQNTDALISELQSWVTKRRSEAGTCTLCFSDKRKND
ncbi:Putative von Willebrand factor A-like domain superfamily [Septoria linicola]|uniref:von Willebrand factor A-like domain superfamily n=1 Tax=Septoria linicola TaxID=215465 RepID=A0A9Q9AZH4_9PEZI|nr:Putative von Willebrand factor A-like domain superfamily [Septoria linicola]